MIGLLQLYWIDNRLRQIFPNDGRSEMPFRCINILLCGDFYQLPPVGMSPLYDTRGAAKPEITSAKELYRLFDYTVRLSTIMRQQSVNEDSIWFRTLRCCCLLLPCSLPSIFVYRVFSLSKWYM